MKGRTIEAVAFALVPSFSLFLAINGKPIAVCVFADGTCAARLDFEYVALHVFLLMLVALLSACRLVGALATLAARGALGAGGTLIACAGVLLLHTPASPLPFFLVIGVFVSVTFVMTLELYLPRSMDVEFWKLAFDSLMKIFQWGFVGVALMVAALTAFSQGHLDMVTTLAYPVVVIMVQFAMVAYWNVLPIWDRITDAYTLADGS